ncbi:MAG: alpha-hydroxy-acid oxidizing protein [Oscillospiraceae bacterium]|nr:alpha-hydroxy-acid oxidizing protein [Oscillospiraceae bacterium]
MNYSEVLENARKNIGPNCKACPVCNGLACGNTLPGPGSKAPGNGANDNYNAWRRIKLNMDTIVANTEIDTSTELFGKRLDFPLVSAPIGSIRLQYNPTDDVRDFNEQCMAACESRGLVHFYSSGLQDEVHAAAIASRIAHGNAGVPVINPEADGKIIAQMNRCNESLSPIAITVVVDSAGLPHLKQCHGDGGTKSVEQLAKLKAEAKVPFVVKGIMTAKSALKAIDAGADAIIVSNHGGRVLADSPATAEVLEEIADAVNGRAKIIVDGGIRSGIDMFKAYALGADFCMICRPVLVSYYGGGQAGIECYFDKLKSELVDTMYMCGARSIGEISREMLRI